MILDDNIYDHFDKKTVYIYESLQDYLVVRDGKARKSGLAKLTDVEKKALGLI